MRVTVLLFAGAAEAAGADHLVIEMQPPVTASTVRAAIAADQPMLNDWLPACRLAVDATYVEDDFVVPADAEVALIPPVSGG